MGGLSVERFLFILWLGRFDRTKEYKMDCYHEDQWDGVCTICGLVVDNTPIFSLQYQDEQYYYGSTCTSLGTNIKYNFKRNGRLLTESERHVQNRIIRCHLYTQTREKKEIGHEVLKAYRSMFEQLHIHHGLSNKSIDDSIEFLKRIVTGQFGVYRAERLNGLMIAYLLHQTGISLNVLKIYLPKCMRKHIVIGERRLAELLKEGLDLTLQDDPNRCH